MSQKTGRAPNLAMTPAVAKNENGLVITSSPRLTFDAMSARSSASVPDDTPIPLRAPEYFAIALSSRATCLPSTNC